MCNTSLSVGIIGIYTVRHSASIVCLNEELTQFHAEVLNNLNSIHGALLRMNRSIQSEGTFGTVKWNRSYIRARCRGLKSLFLEF